MRLIEFSLIVVVMASAIGLIAYSLVDDPSKSNSIAWASGMGIAYALVGMLMINWAFSRPARLFMAIVFGGIGIRLLSAGIMLVVAIRVLHLDIPIFLSVFGVLYVLLQVVEIFYLNREAKLRRVSDSDSGMA